MLPRDMSSCQLCHMVMFFHKSPKHKCLVASVGGGLLRYLAFFCPSDIEGIIINHKHMDPCTSHLLISQRANTI